MGLWQQCPMLNSVSGEPSKLVFGMYSTRVKFRQWGPIYLKVTRVCSQVALKCVGIVSTVRLLLPPHTTCLFNLAPALNPPYLKQQTLQSNSSTYIHGPILTQVADQEKIRRATKWQDQEGSSYEDVGYNAFIQPSLWWFGDASFAPPDIFLSLLLLFCFNCVQDYDNIILLSLSFPIVYLVGIFAESFDRLNLNNAGSPWSHTLFL